MRDEINQNISRLLDDDLGHGETLSLLGKIQTDDALKAKMLRYQAISSILKKEDYCYFGTDFSKKISQQIEQEPAYLLPQRKSIKINPKVYIAAAASALIAAVLVGQFSENRFSTDGIQNMAAVGSSSPAVVGLLARNDSHAQTGRHPMTAQFNDYLQAHNSSVYTNGEANFHPYAKMAAYGQE